jgi:formylglycine-generating enzyme required for sulfatase activity
MKGAESPTQPQAGSVVPTRVPASHRNSSPASVFEKILGAYDTGGFTLTDTLQELKRLLESGAPPTQLSDILRRRELVEPLPPHAHEQVVSLLSDVRPRTTTETPAASEARRANPDSSADAFGSSTKVQTSVYEKILGVFEASGVTDTDALAQLKGLLLATGASPTALLDVLRRRRLIDALPRHAVLELLGLLNDAQARAAAEAAMMADKRSAASDPAASHLVESVPAANGSAPVATRTSRTETPADATSKALSSVFEKVLGVFETSGFTDTDVLAKLKRLLLATGASPAALLGILRHRQKVDPLPEHAHAKVLALLNEVIEQATGHSAVPDEAKYRAHDHGPVQPQYMATAPIRPVAQPTDQIERAAKTAIAANSLRNAELSRPAPNRAREMDSAPVSSAESTSAKTEPAPQSSSQITPPVLTVAVTPKSVSIEEESSIPSLPPQVAAPVSRPAPPQTPTSNEMQTTTQITASAPTPTPAPASAPAQINALAPTPAGTPESASAKKESKPSLLSQVTTWISARVATPVSPAPTPTPAPASAQTPSRSSAAKQLAEAPPAPVQITETKPSLLLEVTTWISAQEPEARQSPSVEQSVTVPPAQALPPLLVPAQTETSSSAPVSTPSTASGKIGVVSSALAPPPDSVSPQTDGAPLDLTPVARSLPEAATPPPARLPRASSAVSVSARAAAVAAIRRLLQHSPPAKTESATPSIATPRASVPAPEPTPSIPTVAAAIAKAVAPIAAQPAPVAAPAVPTAARPAAPVSPPVEEVTISFDDLARLNPVVAPQSKRAPKAVPVVAESLALKRGGSWKSGSRAIGLGAGAAAVLIAATVVWLSDRPAPIPAPEPEPVRPLTAMPPPGTVIRDCAQCPAMTVLPVGRFKQGSAVVDSGSSAFDKPLHWVNITQPFSMSTNTVTVDEFQQFIASTRRDMQGCDTYDGSWKHRAKNNWKSPGFSQTGTHPVTCVSWNDAQAYARWISAKTGHRYRLPSASEWEFAARSGGEAVLPWNPDGSDACSNANVADQSAVRRYPGWTAFGCSDGYVYTAPVGSFKANAFGLNDTLGNVFQWTQDCWTTGYAGAPIDGSARTDGNCGERELRGGSWFSTPAYVRASYRNHFAADYRTNSVGIRLVRELEQ